MKQLTFNWVDLCPATLDSRSPSHRSMATEPQQRDYHFYQPFFTIEILINQLSSLTLRIHENAD